MSDTPSLFDDTIKTPKRKNNPELARHNLLIAAKDIMLSQGIANLSMQKVADFAGISKGGLFHHFKNKDELIAGVIELFIAQINTAILAQINDLGEQKGVFTKAYVNVFFDDASIGLSSDWAGLLKAMSAEKALDNLWQQWLANKLKQYSHTDDDIRFATIRCAVDGVWLNQAQDLPAIKTYLLTLIDDVITNDD